MKNLFLNFGDRVTWNYNGEQRSAVFVEDRGPWGKNGDRVCLVQCVGENEEPDGQRGTGTRSSRS